MRTLPREGDRIPVAALEALAADMLCQAGMRRREAETMASVLVFAQASAIGSHGLMHLPHYVLGMVEGRIRPRPDFRFQSSRLGAAVLDADDGPGVLAAIAATDRAVQLGAKAGAGVVAVRNSGHFGAASAFVDRIVGRGMVGIALSNASPTVAPRGGTRPAFGTNPIAVGFPRAGGFPVIIDFASAAGSRARIRKAAAEGVPIPDDWALDESGHPTTDAEVALRGTMQALGGAKGTAIGLMVELLCVSLSGGVIGTQVRPPQDRSADRAGVSHLFLALDPAAFGGGHDLAATVETIAGGIEAGPPADPAFPVRMPGARAARARQEAAERGILVSKPLAEALRKTENVLAGMTLETGKPVFTAQQRAT